MCGDFKANVKLWQVGQCKKKEEKSIMGIMQGLIIMSEPLNVIFLDYFLGTWPT